MYGSEIWGTSIINKKNKYDFYKSWDNHVVEKLHTNFCRYVLGVHKRASISGVRGELGRYPLAIDILVHMLKFWQHIESSENVILHNALEESKLLHTQGKYSWFSQIKNLLSKLGSKILTPTKQNINTFKHKLHIDYKLYWKDSLGEPDSENGKLSTYRLIKNTFSFENYLSAIRCKKYRSIYTSIRISAHQLAIEKDRYAKPFIPRGQRLCRICSKSQAIEDEKHFLLECCAYEKERQNTLAEIYKIYPQIEKLNTLDKFIYLMTAEGNICQKVSKFCYDSYEVRKTITSVITKT